MTTLSAPMQKLLTAFRVWREVTPVEEVPKIHVDEIAAKIAAFYEKVRNIVDYHDEHLLRKRFILRALKRRLIMQRSDDMAEALIKEIIRSGHLPNDTIPQGKIPEVQQLIDGMRVVTDRLRGQNPREARALEEWLIEIAANSIEENLVPPAKDAILFELAFATVRKDCAVTGAALSEDEIALHLFVALQRSLFRVDDDQLCYRLFAFIAPQWKLLPGMDAERIAMELPALKNSINAAMKSRHIGAFEKLCNRYNTAFFLIGDIIEEYQTIDAFTGLLQDEAALKSAIARMYARRFERERHRLHRLAFFSVLSFLLSKITIALAVEIPIETYLTHSFSLTNTILNILFPPFLMLMIVAGIRMPGKKNAELATAAVAEIVYEEKPRRYFIVIPKRHGIVVGAFMYGTYLALFALSFNALYRVLTALHFNIANIIVFALFVSLVLAAGVRIKNRARDLSVAPLKATVASFILDLFIFPFITVGQWIISGLAKFNVLVLAMNAVIELPFQFLVEFLENLRGFIESKKDKLR
ncbi:MAG: hypothetical protein Q7R85_00340 [bacterium]|nr:hypothetical protein [bacterium]